MEIQHVQISKFLFSLVVVTCLAALLIVTGCGGKSASMSANVNPSPLPTTASPSSTAPPAPPSPAPSPTPTPAPSPTPPPASSGPSAPANAITNENIEDLPGWQWCTAQSADHRTCASGLGNAVSSKTDNQSSPSRDGSSSRFYIAGPTGYSNALWWKTLDPNPDVTHFLYDLWFFIDNPDASQALEFDVNQTFGGTRFTWGSECNFKDTHKWDIWDPAAGKWVPTQFPCVPFSANTWHHLTWQLERVNGKVHYIALTIDGQTMNVDTYMDPQGGVMGNEVDVAFQLDGDINQTPYNVWLDQVTLSEW